MARSPNGYSVDPPNRRPIKARGVEFVGAGVRKGAVYVVLRHVAVQVNDRVEPLRKGWCWSGLVRPITGGSGWSNHASLTALDFNAPRHPYGVRGTFTAKQRRELRKIAHEVDGVVRFGEFYSNPDGMHIEIDAPIADVRRTARRIKAAKRAARKGRKVPTSRWLRRRVKATTGQRTWRGARRSLRASLGLAPKGAFTVEVLDAVRHRLGLPKSTSRKKVRAAWRARLKKGHLL